MAPEKQPKTLTAALERQLSKTGKAVVACRAISPYSGCHWEYCYFFVERRDPSSVYSVKPVHLVGDMRREFDRLGGCGAEAAESFLRAELERAIWEGEPSDYVNFEVVPVDARLSRGLSFIFYQEFIAVLGNSFRWKCSVCDEEVLGGPCHHHGYRGNGGVGIVHTDAVCDACDSNGTCGTCGTYLGVDAIDQPTRQCLDCLAKVVVEEAQRGFKPTAGVGVRANRREYFDNEMRELLNARKQVTVYCALRPEYAAKAEKQHADAVVRITQSIRQVLLVR